MKTLEIKEIGARNFHSFENFVLKIVSGKTLVSGLNGSGKSSIFEIIPWTFYKSSQRGKNPSRNYKGDCFTYVVFEKDGKEYRVERYLNDKSFGSTLKIFLDGVEISKRLKTSSEKDLLEILEIGEDLFTSTVVVLQGLPGNFSSLTPVLRKYIIEEMLNFSLWDVLKKRVAAQLEVMGGERGELLKSFSEKKESMISLNSKIEALEAVQKTSFEDDHKQLMFIKQMLHEQDEEYKKLSQQKTNLLQENDLLRYHSLDSYLSQLTHQAAYLHGETNKLKQTIGSMICPECGQRYPQEKVQFVEAKISQNMDEVKGLGGLILKVEGISKQIRGIDAKLREYENNLFSLNKDLQIYMGELRKPRNIEELSELKPKLMELHEEVNVLKTELDKVMEEEGDLEFLKSLMAPSSKFRTNVLKSYIGHINDILDSITPILFEKFQINLVIENKEAGIEILIKRDNEVFQYKSLSGGQRRKLDIAIILSLQKFLLEFSGISTNLLVFDEIFDSLDDSSINLVINAINSLFPESSSIYIITHNNSIKSMFDSIIRVINTNGSSQIEV